MKKIPLRKILEWRSDLEKKHGQKIIPGCANDEDLNEEEKVARALYTTFGEFLIERTGWEYKVTDTLYEVASRIQYFIKKKLPKLLIGILGILVFLALIKYLFF